MVDANQTKPAIRRSSLRCVPTILALVLIVSGGLFLKQNGWLNAPVETVLHEQQAIEAPPLNVIVRVVDEHGQPVPSFQLQLRRAGGNSTGWKVGAYGEVNVRVHETLPLRESFTIDAIVRASGFATAVSRFTGLDRELLFGGEATVTLRRGKKIELRFSLPQGLNQPSDWKPDVYFANHRYTVRQMWTASSRRVYKGNLPDFNFLNVTPLDDVRFEFRLADGSEPFYVAVHSPGFLQCFETGPFTTKDIINGVLEIGLPEPASLHISFDPGDEVSGTMSLETVALAVLLRDPTKLTETYKRVILQVGDAKLRKLELGDLAPGTYKARAVMRTKSAVQALPQSTGLPDVSYDSSEVTLEAGETRYVVLRYVPFDREAFRGDWTAKIRIVNFDGSPAAGGMVAVYYRDERYGDVKVFSGQMPRSEDLEISGLTKPKPRNDNFGSYRLEVDGLPLGWLSSANARPSEPFIFRLPPVAGDVAPNIKLVNISTGAHSTLQDLRGRVVCLELWATGCGPCQLPMQKLNHMALHNRNKWRDQVAIVAVSIDDEPEDVLRYVKQRAWDHINHYWNGSKGSIGYDAPVMRAFDPKGVPHLVIINRKGRVVWSGHPLDQSNGKDIADRIDEALGK